MIYIELQVRDSKSSHGFKNFFACHRLTFLINRFKYKYYFHFSDQIPVLGIVAVGSGLALIIFGMSSFLIYRYVFGSELVDFAFFFPFKKKEKEKIRIPGRMLGGVPVDPKMYKIYTIYVMM